MICGVFYVPKNQDSAPQAVTVRAAAPGVSTETSPLGRVLVPQLSRKPRDRKTNHQVCFRDIKGICKAFAALGGLSYIQDAEKMAMVLDHSRWTKDRRLSMPLIYVLSASAWNHASISHVSLASGGQSAHAICHCNIRGGLLSIQAIHTGKGYLP